ncbi:unnamed protein product [Linum trigynum]|uniref:Uncharacterized protein n=1 Tax=Linum trigynum TaxID=586398 RepID=A0AAV2CE29_9ROSI
MPPHPLFATYPSSSHHPPWSYDHDLESLIRAAEAASSYAAANRFQDPYACHHYQDLRQPEFLRPQWNPWVLAQSQAQQPSSAAAEGPALFTS